MGIRREEDFWQGFNALLPDRDPVRQEALRTWITRLRQNRRVDLDQVYSALDEAARAARAEAKAHRTFTEARPWLRQGRGLLRKVKRLERNHGDFLADLDEQRKAAFRAFATSENPYSTGPADEVSQRVADVRSAMGQDPSLQFRRPEGHQFERWRREGHQRLRKAGIRSAGDRAAFLRLVDPKPYPKS